MSEAAETPAPVADPAGPPSKLGAKLGKKRGRRLANIHNVKGALADVIRELEADRMDVQKARALVYALSTLAGVIQGNDFADRIAALEVRGL